MAIIIFATLWGLALKGWRGASRRTRTLVAMGGCSFLASSTVVVGYGNYLTSQPARTHTKIDVLRRARR
jgi:L-rhamnose-H+ transport protein